MKWKASTRCILRSFGGAKGTAPQGTDGNKSPRRICVLGRAGARGDSAAPTGGNEEINSSRCLFFKVQFHQNSLLPAIRYKAAAGGGTWRCSPAEHARHSGEVWGTGVGQPLPFPPKHLPLQCSGHTVMAPQLRRAANTTSLLLPAPARWEAPHVAVVQPGFGI